MRLGRWGCNLNQGVLLCPADTCELETWKILTALRVPTAARATDLERSASGSVACEQKDDEEHVEDAMIVITAITIIPVITTTITMIVVMIIPKLRAFQFRTCALGPRCLAGFRYLVHLILTSKTSRV